MPVPGVVDKTLFVFINVVHQKIISIHISHPKLCTLFYHPIIDAIMIVGLTAASTGT